MQQREQPGGAVADPIGLPSLHFETGIVRESAYIAYREEINVLVAEFAKRFERLAPAKAVKGTSVRHINEQASAWLQLSRDFRQQ